MTKNQNERTRVCLFGAAPDSGNLGVSALWHSVTAGLVERVDNLELTVFDMLRGVRPARVQLGDRQIQYRRIGANLSRRYYSTDCLWNMVAAGFVGGGWNPGVHALREADVVVDVSGGDSFTDLYGAKRFRAITLHKLIALRNGAPLILLPQTYGPFRGVKNRKLAEQIVRRARMAWARDPRSFAALRELLGDEFDPDRHRSGVDMAFGLLSQAPAVPIADPVGAWLNRIGNRDDGSLLVGINVSGLLYGKEHAATSVFGFCADYVSIIHGLIERLLVDERVRIVLVPHVYGARESDVDACQAVEKALRGIAGGRLATLPGELDQCEVKWVISKMDWFCGTRMHSTIAALSAGVPAAAVAYSLKTAGVFETCDLGDHVADPRQLDTPTVIEKLCRSFDERGSAKETLAAALPSVLGTASGQLDAIARAFLPVASSSL